MDSEKKLNEANALLQEAKSLENNSGGFLSKLFGSSSGKLDDAASIYKRAGNQFKAIKAWDQAGNAFRNAARLLSDPKLNLRHDAAQSLVDAGTVFRKSNHQMALDAYKEAVEILTDMGRFTMAAKHLASCGDIYSEHNDARKAVESYQQAADYYRSEESHTTADKHSLKAADLMAAELHDYIQAQQIYEQIGNRCSDSNLLKYSAKDHFFKAAMCNMNVDVINAQQALERYPQILPSFQDTREFKLVQALVKAMDEHKVEDYTQAVHEYDQITRLNDFQTTLLLRAKKTIDDDAGDDDLT